MPIIRSFDNAYTVTDYTDTIIQIPNTWGLINEMGIFSPEGVSQHSITVESQGSTLGLIGDKARGERNNVGRDFLREMRSFPIPHFPYDDAVKPNDVQGKRAFNSPDAPETTDAVVARKLEYIRRNQAITLEFARAQALTQGTVYAPNGTVSVNYYTDFGVTRKEIDFTLGTATAPIIAKSEEALAHIQDNTLTGEVVTGVVVLCSPEFFSKLIDNASVKEAYKFYTSTQEPLRTRLGSGVYRRFVHGSVEYVEYRGSYNGVALIPAGDAYMIPTGTSDTFKTYFSPANHFDYVNTIGEQVYAWSFRNQSNTEITLQSESNFLNLIRRPQCVVRLFSSN